MSGLSIVRTFVAGPYRVENYPDALQVCYLPTTARQETIAFGIVAFGFCATVSLTALGIMLFQDVEGQRWIGYVVSAGSALIGFSVLSTLVDNVRPKAYIFDKTKDGLFKRNKRLCSLGNISRIEVVPIEDSDNVYYSGRVYCGEREVWRFDSERSSLATATKSQKQEVYQVADEISRFLGIALPAEDSGDT